MYASLIFYRIIKSSVNKETKTRLRLIISALDGTLELL